MNKQWIIATKGKYLNLFHCKAWLNLKVMELSKEAIEEYKQIYKEKFGEEISDEEAREQGENLISLFRVIYHPIPGKDYRIENKPEKHSSTFDNSV